MTKKLPKGTRMNRKMRVAVQFDPDLFERIKQFAAVEDKTFSETVNMLCEIGIFDLMESDALEVA